MFFGLFKGLENVSKFPLDHLVLDKFEKLKQSVAQATLQAFSDNKPFVVKYDASEVAVSVFLMFPFYSYYWSAFIRFYGG